MKYLVLSDIHGNLDALEAVLGDSLAAVEGVLCLGDTVGYGPDPGACVDRILGLRDEGLPFAAVLGNHDAAAAGLLSSEWFNPHARRAVEYARSVIGPGREAWLASLPEEAFPPGDGQPTRLITHGSPLEPVTGYLFGGPETLRALEELERRGISLCFVGHTHMPAFYSARRGASLLCPAPGTEAAVDPEGLPSIVNPGSVGFPRSLSDDQDPARYPAEYALWDSDAGTVTFMNARYDRRPFEERLEALWASFE